MRILIIDSQNIAYTAFHAMGQLDYLGQRTGVIFGFLLRVIQLSKDLGTTRFVFCWDSSKSARKKLFTEYKNRGIKRPHQYRNGVEIPFESMKGQVEELRTSILPELGFCNHVMYNGLEADDGIALVIRNGEFPKKWTDKKFIIVSYDKDLYQLLSSNVIMYNIKKKSMFTDIQFEMMYGIPPNKWAIAKAYSGCDTDKVPGIRGISDPAHSTKSRILVYLKGEANEKLRNRIESPEGQAIYNRNIKLVKLPFVGGLVPEIQEDVFYRKKWISVFSDYGFESFLRKEQLDSIATAFELKD